MTVSAAGEIVPAFEVLDAVGAGVAEMGHSAAFYWQGKEPAAAFFTTVPFALTPGEHVQDRCRRRSDAVDELYAPFGVKPFMGGNTGVRWAAGFAAILKGGDDVRGLENPFARPRRRSLSVFGAMPQTTSPGEIVVALQSVLSTVPNSSAPVPTSRSGCNRFAPFYYGPGFNKPNGTGECIVSLKAWNALDAELKAIVEHACAAKRRSRSPRWNVSTSRRCRH